MLTLNKHLPVEQNNSTACHIVCREKFKHNFLKKTSKIQTYKHLHIPNPRKINFWWFDTIFETNILPIITWVFRSNFIYDTKDITLLSGGIGGQNSGGSRLVASLESAVTTWIRRCNNNQFQLESWSFFRLQNKSLNLLDILKYKWAASQIQLAYLESAAV